MTFTSFLIDMTNFRDPVMWSQMRKRKRQGNEMFSSQHDCIIDDDETISSNDQGSCNDAETPNRNTCKNNSKQLRCNYKN